jgi:thiamine biosynthesis lipoprotein ApbE
MQLANVDDPTVKKAVLANIVIETVVAVVTAGLFAYQLSGGALGESIARKFKTWRSQVFGPPPPTEEEIERQTHLLRIDIARFEREST